MSQAAVAEAAGISRIGYRNVETGRSNPQVKTLERIASALAVPPGEILRESRILRSVRFRAAKKMRSREQILIEVGDRLDTYDLLEEMSPGHGPGFAFAAARSVNADADERPCVVAAAARESVEVPEDQPIQDICALLEEGGVRVITPSVAAPGFYGLSVVEDDGGPAIVVNTWERITVERWIFTAAHELGHLLLHKGSYDVDQEQEDPDEEREADQFAGYFLMPQDLFVSEWHKTRGQSLIDRVFTLKRYFRVSYQTVLYRIAHSIQDPQAVYRQFTIQYKRRFGQAPPRTSEPAGLEADAFSAQGHRDSPAPPRKSEAEKLVRYDFVGHRLFQLVYDAYQDRKISHDQIPGLLGLDEERAKEVMESWELGLDA